MVYIDERKSLGMLHFSKSREDLKKSKSDVQHRVICDWLRNISNQNIQIARKITSLTNLILPLLENEDHAESMEMTDNNPGTDSQSI